MSKVIYERKGNLFFITINRPEVRNAADPETGKLIEEAYRAFRDDDEALVSLITGAGDEAFCAGWDLKAFAAGVTEDNPGIDMDIDHSRIILQNDLGPMGYTRGVDIFKPTIAAINGWCVAGGLELATWCDLRIASDTAKFGLLNRRWNVPMVDGATVRLPRIIGQGRAMDMLITGRIVEAEEALSWGLVNRVVPKEKLMEETIALAKQICSNPQGCLRTEKESMLRSYGHTLKEAYFIEGELGNFSFLRGTTGMKSAAIFAAGKGRAGKPTGKKWERHGL